MSSDLERQLADLPEEIQRSLSNRRFDRRRFLALAERLRNGERIDNRAHGIVAPPEPEDIQKLPEPSSPEWSRIEGIGLEALAQGQCALIVMAGGMATRMGGVVKALVDAIGGKTFLDVRLAEMDALERRMGRRPRLWLMTSEATDASIREALGDRIDGEHLGVFCQSLSLRLNPDGSLFVDADGKPSAYAPGHGDLPDALRQSGLLHRFVEQGGRSVMVANVDNLGATLDPAVIGWHLDQRSPVTAEVVDKVGSDRGGIPVRLDGKPVILEEFRLPEGFDAAQVRVFNTNTFHFDARALLELSMDWTYFAVNKQVDDKPVVQFERLIGEVTSNVPTAFLHVSREGGAARFVPVKDPAELEQRREQIAEILRARGIDT